MGAYLGPGGERWNLVFSGDRGLIRIVSEEELPGVLAEHSDGVPPASAFREPEECRQLSLLMNSRCNFKCSYCYAAQSRTDEELSADRIMPLLERWMSNPALRSADELEVSFSGGGEPLLSMPEIEKTVSAARALAFRLGKALRFSMATNGSLLDDWILGFLERNRFRLFYSFELLEDLQRRQRGVWQPVRDNLVKVLQRDIPCTVKCVITRLSMSRQPEMAECAVRDFPGLRRLTFNQMELIARQCTLDEYREYLDEAIPGFFAARRLAARHGVSVSSYDFQRMSRRSCRCCPVPPVVAPHGGITFCTAASSPKEDLYPFVSVGEISPSGGISFEEGRLARLKGYRADGDPHCRHCAARDFCGGGCPVARHVYSPAQMSEYCRGRRRFLAFMAMEYAESRLRAAGIDSMGDWLAGKPPPEGRRFQL
jgi:uncharacterized protein